MSQLRGSGFWTPQLYERKCRATKCREPNLTMVSFLPLVSDQGYHKVIVFSAIGAVRTKMLVVEP
jgi:hypothetical protein